MKAWPADSWKFVSTRHRGHTVEPPSDLAHPVLLHLTVVPDGPGDAVVIAVWAGERTSPFGVEPIPDEPPVDETERAIVERAAKLHGGENK